MAKGYPPEYQYAIHPTHYFLKYIDTCIVLDLNFLTRFSQSHPKPAQSIHFSQRAQFHIRRVGMSAIGSSVGAPKYTPPKQDQPKAEESQAAEETKAADQAPPEDNADAPEGADEGSPAEQASDSGKDNSKDLNQDPANVYGKALVNFVSQNDSDIDADSDAEDVAEEAADKAADAKDKTGKGTFLDFEGTTKEQNGNQVSTLALGEEGGNPGVSDPTQNKDAQPSGTNFLDDLGTEIGNFVDSGNLKDVANTFKNALGDPETKKDIADTQNDLGDITQGIADGLSNAGQKDVAKDVKRFGQALDDPSITDSFGDIQGGLGKISDAISGVLPKDGNLNLENLGQTLGDAFSDKNIQQGSKTIENGFGDITNVFSGALDSIFGPDKAPKKASPQGKTRGSGGGGGGGSDSRTVPVSSGGTVRRRPASITPVSTGGGSASSSGGTSSGGTRRTGGTNASGSGNNTATTDDKAATEKEFKKHGLIHDPDGDGMAALAEAQLRQEEEKKLEAARIKIAHQGLLNKQRAMNAQGL
jgi:hypothetical protein